MGFRSPLSAQSQKLPGNCVQRLFESSLVEEDVTDSNANNPNANSPRTTSVQKIGCVSRFSFLPNPRVGKLKYREPRTSIVCSESSDDSSDEDDNEEVFRHKRESKIIAKEVSKCLEVEEPKNSYSTRQVWACDSVVAPDWQLPH